MKVGENYQQICLYFIEYMCEILLNKYKALKRLKKVNSMVHNKYIQMFSVYVLGNWHRL